MTRQLTNAEKNALDGASIMHDSIWAGIEKSFGKDLTPVKVYGGSFGLAISLIKGDTFGEIVFGVGLGAFIGVGATFGLGFIATPVAAAIGGAVIGGISSSILGETDFGKATSKQITDVSKRLGDAIGSSMTDFIKHDWAGDYAKGKSQFEKTFNEKFPEFWESVKKKIGDFATSSDAFTRQVWDKIKDGTSWAKNQFGKIWDDISDWASNTGGYIEKKFIDLGRYIVDPLTLDLNGDGIALTNADTSKVKFDMDNDGFKEQTGWIDGKDGFLVRDLNNNGKIETLNEFIGNDKVSGLAMLKTLDSNKDGIIDSKDSAWNSLRVWQDKNSNGITDAGELNSLATHKITSFRLHTANDNADIKQLKIA